MATNITDADFEEIVLKSDVPVLVDFWAEWCGPCKQIAPALEELSKEMEGKLKIVKMNVDENQKIPTELRIQAIPTLMLFNKGEMVDRQMGALAKSKIESWVNKTISA
ncbi:MAG: thioredoxin [Hyphomicrobiaceae bacterium]|nr:thioredoxin [Hyphomicrobiaceae bacterium]